MCRYKLSLLITFLSITCFSHGIGYCQFLQKPKVKAEVILNPPHMSVYDEGENLVITGTGSVENLDSKIVLAKIGLELKEFDPKTNTFIKLTSSESGHAIIAAGGKSQVGPDILNLKNMGIGLYSVTARVVVGFTDSAGTTMLNSETVAEETHVFVVLAKRK